MWPFFDGIRQDMFQVQKYWIKYRHGHILLQHPNRKEQQIVEIDVADSWDRIRAVEKIDEMEIPIEVKEELKKYMQKIKYTGEC